MRLFKQFGGRVTKEVARQYKQSANWRNGCFQNLEHTELGVNLLDFPRVIYKQLSNSSARVPQQPLPIQAFDQSSFLAPSEKAKFIWYGHAAVLLRLEGKNILIDPMLGPDTTPIAPIPVSYTHLTLPTIYSV